MKRIAVVFACAGVKLANALTNFFVLVGLLAFMAVGIYGLWDNKEIETAGMSTTWEAYKPDPREETLGFDDLQKINPEVQAWLTLYGTNIDYPVVYSDNEWKYLNRNPKGEHALAGSLFFDSQTLPDLSSFPTVIYGHHMAHNAMFGQLDDYHSKDFLKKHRYGNYYYNGRNWGLEVIGFFHANAYDSTIYRPHTAQNLDRRNQYIEHVTSQMNPKLDGVTIRDEDGLLVLSTCASDETNSRTVVIARITNETYPDTFPEDEKNTGTGLSDNRGWFGIPRLAWILFFVALAAFLLLIIVRRIDDRREQKARQARSVDGAPDSPPLTHSGMANVPGAGGNNATDTYAGTRFEEVRV